jgi:hypothetical protein
MVYSGADGNWQMHDGSNFSTVQAPAGLTAGTTFTLRATWDDDASLMGFSTLPTVWTEEPYDGEFTQTGDLHIANTDREEPVSVRDLRFWDVAQGEDWARAAR